MIFFLKIFKILETDDLADCVIVCVTWWNIIMEDKVLSIKIQPEIFNWTLIESYKDLDEFDESIYAPDMVLNDVPYFVDRDFKDFEFGDSYFDSLLKSDKKIEWKLTHKIVVKSKKKESDIKKLFYKWEDEDKLNVVYYVYIKGDGLIGAQVIINGKKRGLISGCSCSHPFAASNDFTFGNSDGSSNFEGEISDKLIAEEVIDNLIDMANGYLFSQCH